MPDLFIEVAPAPTHQQFWDLANAALALGSTISCLIALLLGMAFVRAVWA